MNQRGHGHGPGDRRTEPELDRNRHARRHSCRCERKHTPLGVSPAAAGLVEVGDVSSSTVGPGVEQESVEIRKAKPTTEKGGEQAEGAKSADGRSDHIRRVGNGTPFV